MHDNRPTNRSNKLQLGSIPKLRNPLLDTREPKKPARPDIADPDRPINRPNHHDRTTTQPFRSASSAGTTKNQHSTWLDSTFASLWHNSSPEEPLEVDSKKKSSAAPRHPVTTYLQSFRSLLRHIETTLRELSSRQRLAVVALLVLMALSVGGWVVMSQQSNKPKETAGQQPTNTAEKRPTGPVKATPTFPTLLPSDKDAGSLGGWSLISPPGRDPVYAYTDKINSTRIVVSQQKLPRDFTTDTESRISELAKGYDANETVQSDKSTVYIGTSSDGFQSIITHKDNLLVLIKSDGVISKENWATYVTSLR